jgi:hypothetical protein
MLMVITSLKNIYGLSEQEVIELFEAIVPEYKSSKEKSNGHYLEQNGIVVKEKSI